MAVYDKAYELARELKESPEYKEYQKAKQAIQENESAISILKKYRQQQFMIQTAALTGKEPDEQAQSEFGETQELVNMHGPIQRFLRAEERILITLADIQKILNDSLNMLEYI
ncbi:MAG: YlbF family regulator [Bacillota bacterium]